MDRPGHVNADHVKKGDIIHVDICGQEQRCKVTEILDYKQDGFKWRDLEIALGGRPLVMEFTPHEMGIWGEISEQEIHGEPGASLINYRGKDYLKTEYGRAEVTYENDEGEKETVTIEYWVYKWNYRDDHRIAVEDWPEEGFHFYLLQESMELP